MSLEDKRKKVLVVDDEPANIHILIEALGDEFALVAARTGEKALAIAAATPHPDIILLDVMMPNMDGYEVCRRLKANPLTVNIPVIFVTSLSDSGDELHGLKIGAVDYILKPILPELVKARVCSQLNLKQYRDHLEQIVEERTRAEEAIKNNMVFQRVLMDAVPSPIFYKDAACVYIGGNKAFERYLGLSPEQFIGKTVYDISPANLAEKYDEADRELLNNPGVQTYEASVVYADGTLHNVIFNKATFTNAEGKIVGLVGAILDITERKKAEEALHDSEHRLRTLVQSIPDLIWLKDKDGVYLSCNPMLERFFGAGEADIVGKTDYDFVDRRLADSFREHDRKAMAAGKTTSNEEWITFADDGHRAFLDTIKTPMYDARGTLVGVLGIGRDITNRRSVERIKKALGGTIQAIAVTVEARDPYTAGHQRRVAGLALAIATEMNLPIDIIDGIRMAAAIHDLGKISVPAEILSKPTKLKKTEFDLIKEHSQSGCDILKDIDFPWPVARIVLEHHERMNGSGYPNGLSGNDILMESRIITVADVVESMASHRPYRPSLGIEAALEEIERNKGTFYDNTVADACKRLFREKGFQLAQV
ncbi:MAG: PAS domain-containing protein [Deltaproteobacteria bacterium]